MCRCDPKVPGPFCGGYRCPWAITVSNEPHPSQVGGSRTEPLDPEIYGKGRPVGVMPPEVYGEGRDKSMFGVYQQAIQLLCVERGALAAAIVRLGLDHRWPRRIAGVVDDVRVDGYEVRIPLEWLQSTEAERIIEIETLADSNDLVVRVLKRPNKE